MRALLRLIAFVSAVGLLVYGVLDGGDNMWLLVLYLSTVPIGYILFSMVPRQTTGWRRNAWKISAVLVVGFIMLSMQLLRHQFIIASEIASHPRNVRNLTAEARTQRGRVFDRNGAELAGRMIARNGIVQRTYPEPSAGYIVGYHSPELFGTAGLERVYDDYLSGERGDPLERTRSSVLHRPPRGNDLHLTLDVQLQRLGQELLGNRRGAIVALEPRTGSVLAMVSNPSYDPARLVRDRSQPFEEEQARIQTAWEEFNEEGAARLVNRAIQGLYPPGSTFKTVTAAGALDAGVAEPDDVYEDTGRFSVGGFIINDPNRPDEDKTRWTFTEGYQYSLNAVFAQVGLDLGSAGMREYARRFYFEREIPFDLSVTESQVATDPGFLSDPAALASTAIGQGQILATPLQVALTTATIANQGSPPRPYLVSKITTPSGRAVLEQGPEALDRVISPEVAKEMTAIMVTTVAEGSGRRAQVKGVEVAGKTGTAQLGGELDPHAWFTAFAPAEEPQIAVAVLVENAGEGSEVAAPLAGQLISSYLARQDQR
ncbi:MAG: penicillin-binding protein 2 [Chloroflexota bacterium]|nr:penicillin-binding protein 2 [Chloroflexota bacterium]